MAADPERSVISLAARYDAWSTLVERGITPDMFHTHREVWEWLGREATADGVTPDMERTKTRWPKLRLPKLRWNQADGVIRDFTEAHTRRSLAQTLTRASDLVVADKAPEALDFLVDEIEPILQLRSSRSDAADALTDVNPVLEHVRTMLAAHVGGGAPGVETGLRSVTRNTGGPKAGELWVVGARLGVGKSWLLARMAVGAILDGTDVLFLSLEQPVMEVQIRIHMLLAHAMGHKPFGNFVTGNVDFHRYEKFLRSLHKGADRGKLTVISPREPITPAEVGALVSHHRPGLAMVDYLTRLKLPDDMPDWRGVALASGQLKSVAMGTRTPVVVASQLNRDAASGRETLDNSMLSRSDSIGQDADAVLMVAPYRVKGEKLESVRECRMTKYRHGRSGWRMYLDFRPGDGVVEEVPSSQARDLADDELSARGDD